MKYALYNAAGETIFTNYFIESEDNGHLAIWFGADITDPNREFVGWTDCQEKAEDLIGRLIDADTLADHTVAVLWRVEDVMDLLDISDERAETFLEECGESLKTRLFEEGCEIVKILYADSQDDEDEDSPNGKSCGNCGRDLNEDTGVNVEDRGWYCGNCAERYEED